VTTTHVERLDRRRPLLHVRLRVLAPQGRQGLVEHREFVRRDVDERELSIGTLPCDLEHPARDLLPVAPRARPSNDSDPDHAPSMCWFAVCRPLRPCRYFPPSMRHPLRMSLLRHDRTKVPVVSVVTDPFGQAASREKAPAPSANSLKSPPMIARFCSTATICC